MTRWQIIAGLILASCACADTWQCWTTNTTGPQLAPASLAVACKGNTTGGTWTQTITYQVQTLSLQTQALGTPQTVKVTATGVCVDIYSPFPSHAPVIGNTVTSVAGSNMQWYAQTNSWTPSYFNLAGSGVVVWGASQDPVVASTPVNWPVSACQCFNSDCCNPALPVGACATTCPKRGCQSCGGDTTCTPILFDITGHGFHLSDAEGGVLFDAYGNGNPERIAWPTVEGGNGWLALPDANGQITSLQQLFGNLTPQPPTAHPNGFLALAVYDSNHDGIISPEDAIWSKLRIWVDANHDGVSQPSELLTLSQAGILWISLAYRDDPHSDEWGNQYRLKGMVCDREHFLQAREAIWDVWLR